ncbi:zinc ribbon domain-containing protein [Calothrix sp. NIES-3974]|uniref:zinc ribbon domain-containing protein n=1 Tax=Calothrix sp. NIES-3974 TaxID=2005462 RepID=UPI000B5F8FF5|nr:zinc ribbon domain-containing protein [Calothrix sp. NIES-3974]BAZ03802.1 hypothetical protein NIES3974_04320 [Calothrix sp. NIES-3974]
MSSTFCHRCQRQVDSQAVTCPYCQAELKAFGHPGITLHRAQGDRYLCPGCTYDRDDSCNFPQRPFAKECTLYDDWEQRQNKRMAATQQPSWGKRLQIWMRRYQSLLLICGLLIICLIIVISAS